MEEGQEERSNEADDPEMQKRHLEVAKLTLEQKLLARQLSLQGLSLEWLKAAGVPITVLGALVAFLIGFGQLGKSSEAKTADRFDKALSRLASTEPGQRLTGVSGLRTFLRPTSPSSIEQLLGSLFPASTFQEQSLDYFLNALSVEEDDKVQSALLSTIAEISTGSIPTPVLNAALSTAVQTNRRVTAAVLSNAANRIREEKISILGKFKIDTMDLSKSDDKDPDSNVGRLSLK